MEPIIDSIKKFGRWIIRVVKWLWKRKIVFIALILLVGAIFSSWYMPMPDKTSADRFRYTGLALELLGIGTVACGLYETLKSSKSTLRDIILEPFKEFPKLRDNSPVVVPMNGQSEIPALTSLGLGTPLAPNSSVEERVTFLEELLKQVRLQAHENRTNVENEFKKSTNALNAERSEREVSVEKVRQMFDKFAIDGIAIEAIGVVCLVL